VAALRRLLQAEGCQAVGQMVRASSFCLFARKPAGASMPRWRPEGRDMTRASPDLRGFFATVPTPFRDGGIEARACAP